MKNASVKISFITTILSVCVVVAALTSCEPHGKSSKIQNEVLKLKLWDATVSSKFPEPVQDIVTPYVTERTGVIVDDIILNNGVDSSERLNLFVASQDFPDIITINKSDVHIYTSLMRDGIIRSVSEGDIKTYTPDIAKRLSSEWFDIFKFNEDEFYGIPYSIKNDINDWDAENNPRYAEYRLSIISNTGQAVSFGLREDILKMLYPDAYTYDELRDIYNSTGKITTGDLTRGVPKNFDELENLLYEIKEMETDNGEKLIPFLDVDFNSIAIGELYAAEGISGVNEIYFNWKTRETEIACFTPKVKDMIRRINQWCRDGIIPIDMAVNSATENTALLESGNVALIPTSKSRIDHINAKARAKESKGYYRPFLFAQRAGSAEGMRKYYCDVPVSNHKYILINSKFSDHDYQKILGYINFFMTDEGMEISAWGAPEAALYDVEDNKKQFNTDVLKKHVIYGISIPGEKNLDYYGINLDYRKAGRFFTKIAESPGCQPNHHLVDYFPFAHAENGFEAASKLEIINSAPQSKYSGWDWAALDTDAGLSELKQIAEMASARITKYMLPKVLFSSTDEEFEENYNKLCEIWENTAMESKLTLDEYKRKYKALLMGWYDKRSIEYPTYPFE